MTDESQNNGLAVAILLDASLRRFAETVDSLGQALTGDETVSMKYLLEQHRNLKNQQDRILTELSRLDTEFASCRHILDRFENDVQKVNARLDKAAAFLRGLRPAATTNEKE